LATLHQVIGNYFISPDVFFFFLLFFSPFREKLDAFLNAFQTWAIHRLHVEGKHSPGLEERGSQTGHPSSLGHCRLRLQQCFLSESRCCMKMLWV